MTKPTETPKHEQIQKNLELLSRILKARSSMQSSLTK